MADTRFQLEVEDWVRSYWMASPFDMKFSRGRLPICSGGVFDFDAVSEDRSVLATILTSGSKTQVEKMQLGRYMS